MVFDDRFNCNAPTLPFKVRVCIIITEEVDGGEVVGSEALSKAETSVYVGVAASEASAVHVCVVSRSSSEVGDVE